MLSSYHQIDGNRGEVSEFSLEEHSFFIHHMKMKLMVALQFFMMLTIILVVMI